VAVSAQAATAAAVSWGSALEEGGLEQELQALHGTRGSGAGAEGEGGVPFRGGLRAQAAATRRGGPPEWCLCRRLPPLQSL